MKSVRFVDEDFQYPSYCELGEKYREYGTFIPGFMAKCEDIFTLIEYVEHLSLPGIYIAVCKDKCNRVLLIGKEGVKEIKNS